MTFNLCSQVMMILLFMSLNKWESANLYLRTNAKLIVKYNVGLKTLLQQGILGPALYGEFLNKFKSS